jgi:hypothetical protein
MSFAEKVRNFLGKLQNLPEHKKHIILWTIVVALGLAMGYFWINNAIKTFSKLNEQARIVANNQPSVAIEDPTVDWKTYTNKKYGFEFKYPKDIKIINNLSGESYKSGTEILKKPVFLVMDSVDNAGTLTIYNDENKYPIPKMMWIEKEDKVDVNGIAMDRVINGSQDAKLENIYISYSFWTGETSNYNDMQGYLLVAYKHRSDSQSEKLLDQVVSTFKFNPTK